MFAVMIASGAVGLLLFFGGSLLARWIVGRRLDPVALARLLQLVGILLIAAAVFFRPHDPATAAFPPPPDAPESAGTLDVTSTRSTPGASVRDAALRRLRHPAVPPG